MGTFEARAAVEAAKSIAASLGLEAEDAVVLQAANRLAIRLLPCDVLVRVAPEEHRASAEFEVEVARRLAETSSPIALLEPRAEPRVYAQDGVSVTFWRYYEPVAPSDLAAAEYAGALVRLHAGMREVDLAAPHITARVTEAQRLVHDRSKTPDLPEPDREFLRNALRDLTGAILAWGAPEQLLHAEPHPGNLLRTSEGLLFIDLETCSRGPVEFDLSYAPEAAIEHYPGADRELVEDCRALGLALVAAWRWDKDDQFPDGRRIGQEMLLELRTAMARH